MASYPRQARVVVKSIGRSPLEIAATVRLESPSTGAAVSSVRWFRFIHSRNSAVDITRRLSARAVPDQVESGG